MMGEPWVVAYRIETASNVMFTEFFRGDREECQRIEANSALGADDRYRTRKPWKPMIGTAESWDEFVDASLASGDVVLLGA
jgi:hypothetical protein